MDWINQMKQHGWELNTLYHWEHPKTGRKLERRDDRHWWSYTKQERPKRLGKVMGDAFAIVLNGAMEKRSKV